MTIYKASLNKLTEDINVDIDVNNLKVLTSGIVFSPNNQEVKITIDDITISLCFENDTENPKTRISTRYPDEDNIKLVLINFKSSTPQGKIKPVSLIYTELFDIYISYAVTTLNKEEGHRQIAYTISYGERK